MAHDPALGVATVNFAQIGRAAWHSAARASSLWSRPAVCRARAKGNDSRESADGSAGRDRSAG